MSAEHSRNEPASIPFTYLGQKVSEFYASSGYVDDKLRRQVSQTINCMQRHFFGNFGRRFAPEYISREGGELVLSANAIRIIQFSKDRQSFLKHTAFAMRGRGIWEAPKTRGIGDERVKALKYAINCYNSEING